MAPRTPDSTTAVSGTRPTAGEHTVTGSGWRRHLSPHMAMLMPSILVLAALSVPLINLLVGKPTGTSLTAKKASDPALARLTVVFEAKCAHCHVPGTPSPFYAGLPGVSALIRRDITDGLQAIDLVEELLTGKDAMVSEPALAKIERLDVDALDVEGAEALESGARRRQRHVAAHQFHDVGLFLDAGDDFPGQDRGHPQTFRRQGGRGRSRSCRNDNR